MLPPPADRPAKACAAVAATSIPTSLNAVAAGIIACLCVVTWVGVVGPVVAHLKSPVAPVLYIIWHRMEYLILAAIANCMVASLVSVVLLVRDTSAVVMSFVQATQSCQT